MVEGLTVIAAGLLVVFCIILALFAFIEVILKLDQVSRDRAERAQKRVQVPKEQAALAPAPEDSRPRDELMAAIGAAVHYHRARGRAVQSGARNPGSTQTPWASSGRLAIMSDRQRVTSRRG